MSERIPSVLLLYNIPGGASFGQTTGLTESEAGVLEQMEAVRDSLSSLGKTCRVAGVRLIDDLPGVLSSGDEPVVFNLVEGFDRHGEMAAHVPAVCDAFRKSATGSSTACLALTLDKARSKAALAGAGLPVAAGVAVAPGDDVDPGGLPSGRLIVKPVATDASEGVFAASSLFDGAGPELVGAVQRIHRDFRQPALVEQVVGTRELNVSVIRRGTRAEIVAVAEIDFSAFGTERPRIVDYAAKWLPDTFEYQNTPRILPAVLPPGVEPKVRAMALKAWEVVGGGDYGRVDFRMEEDGTLYVLEVNANPDITPEAGFASALEYARIPYAEFVRIMASNAAERRQSLDALQQPKRQAAAAPGLPVPPVMVRPSRADDRDAIMKQIAAVGVFRPDEIDVAQEVLGDSLEDETGSGYYSLTAEVDGRVAGWVCFGPIACSVVACDIYWIVAGPEFHGRGVGFALLEEAERRICGMKGRLAVVETSGRAVYEASRRFYLKAGYTEAARIPGFYAMGDDKLIYTKVLAA